MVVLYGETNMNIENIQSFNDLSHFIGQYVKYEGIVYEIVEVLNKEHKLVLQDSEQHTTIQADQHGEAHRRVPQTMTVHIAMLNDNTPDLPASGIEFLDDVK